MSHEYFKVGTTQALINAVKARIAGKPDSDALSPLLTAGAALGITGEATDSAAWLQRTSTSDGPTTVKGIHGRTVRWNQLVSDSATSVTVPSGHKYVARIDGTTTLATSDGTAITVTGGTDNVFDLTAMFGTGNEPSTVAEFEALYPLPYYEYDAGSLLSVNMEGIETTGFNQWDEQWDNGDINSSTGQNTSGTTVRSKGYVPVFSGQTYYFKCPTDMYLWAYGADKGYLGRLGPSGLGSTNSIANATVTIPATVRFLRFRLTGTYGTTYNNDICINLSDPTRNGEYAPYWHQTRTIPAGTLRGAGAVYDEQTETERIVRVGEVDLGTLEWSTYSSSSTHVFRATYDAFPGIPADHSHSALANAEMARYEQKSYASLSASDNGCFAMSGPQTGRLVIVNHSYSDAAAFKAAMSGVMLHYELATPTTTPIDPPIPMSYRVGAGGTERVMVPTGENSAPPTIVAAQGYTAESLRDAALSCIAPVENGLASTNYGVGSYLVHGGQLCKVTTAIATGEAITIGTNVTATTVMAEVLALVQ